MSGIKDDNGKPRFNQMSMDAIGLGNTAHEYGNIKYEEGNWRRGIDYSRILNALIRHALQRLHGESHDKESGLLHSAHIMANANMLAHYEASGLYEQFDDCSKLLEIVPDKKGKTSGKNK